MKRVPSICGRKWSRSRRSQRFSLALDLGATEILDRYFQTALRRSSAVGVKSCFVV